MPRVVLLSNGSHASAATVRAERIAAALHDGTWEARVVSRTGNRATDARRFAVAAREADVVYAVDLASVPLLAASFRRRTAKLVVDTGDAPSEFFRTVQKPRAQVEAARAMERYAYRAASAFVVRGTYHPALLRDAGFTRQIHVIPDGVDLDMFAASVDDGLRDRLGLADVFTVGIAGRFTWYPKLGGGLGSELLHAMARLPELPVHAVLIGDGPGVPALRALAGHLGIEARLHTLGRVPYATLGSYLSVCDVCLLTQTNEPSSWVRTTGKLPVYLASGRYVLATRVGTAVDVLPPEMLIDYQGPWDTTYPTRLADAIVRVASDPMRAEKGQALRELARRFDYDTIARQAAAVVRDVGR